MWGKAQSRFCHFKCISEHIYCRSVRIYLTLNYEHCNNFLNRVNDLQAWLRLHLHLDPVVQKESDFGKKKKKDSEIRLDNKIQFVFDLDQTISLCWSDWDTFDAKYKSWLHGWSFRKAATTSILRWFKRKWLKKS